MEEGREVEPHGAGGQVGNEDGDRGEEEVWEAPRERDGNPAIEAGG